MTILQTFFADLVKAALISDDATSLRWRDEARRTHAALASDPSAVAGLKIDGIWTLAVREAEAPELRASETRVSFTLPVDCPFSLAEITDPGFDIDAGVERIVDSASTG